MGEFGVEGPELKKLLMLGKKSPMPFAFAPGKTADDVVLSLHRTKGVDVLRRATKEESGAAKVAAGTFEVIKKEMRCTCDVLVPGMAKKLKKYLKTQKCALNVIIMDAAGNILESDVEDLPDDPDFDGEDGGQQAAAPAGNETPPPGPQTEGQDAGEPPAKDDPRLARLREAVKLLAGRIGSLPEGEARTAAGTALREAAAAIAATEVEAAMLAVKRAQDALARGTADQVTGGNDSDNDAKKWAETAAKLGPVVAQLLQAGKGDTSALRTVWGIATEKAEGGDPASALKVLPKLVELIKAAQAATKSEAQTEIPKDVVAFVSSRLAWIKTRTSLRDELASLKAAIIEACRDDEEFPNIAAESDALFAYLGDIDDRLEKTLEQLIVTPDGEGRQKLKSDAKIIVQDYMTTLDQDFFKDVDDNNGFMKLQVRSAALSTLGEVSKALV